MKKMLSLLCAAAMLVAFGAGCKSNDKDSSDVSGTPTKKELRVATNAEFEPWETLDANNNVVGADADIINAVADKMGMTVKFQNMKFEGVVGSVASGASDVAISGLTINATRLKSVDFSTPYYEGAAQILIVKKDDTTFTGTTKEELDAQLVGKRIGVCITFTGEAYAKGDEDWGFAGIKDAQISSFDNIGLAIQDMKNGKLDAIIMDDSVAKDAVATDENKDSVKTIDVPLTVEKYGIAIKKGNTELLNKVNAALKELKDSGELDNILKKWNV